MKSWAIAALSAALLSFGGVARAEPSAHGDQAAGLVADVERVVAVEEGAGWFVDEEAFRSSTPKLLESVCRAVPEARQVARATLAARSARAGSPRALFEAEGQVVTAAVREARTEERRLHAFERALAAATRDCPYWEVPSADFRGRQTDRDRFTLSLETGGLVQLRQTDGTWTFGGGGYGRLLPGYGFGGDVTILAGPEFGGGAMLRPRTNPTELVINYVPALPVIVRFHEISWHYDVEVAPVALFQADDTAVSYGGRVGAGFGVKALRTRGVLPWAGLAVAYEHYLASGGRPQAHLLRGGLRIGLMWDP